MKNTDSVVSFLAVYRVLLDDLILNDGNYVINVDYDIYCSTLNFNIFNDNVMYYKKRLSMSSDDAKVLKNLIRLHFINSCDIFLSGIFVKGVKKSHNIYFSNIRLNVSILDDEVSDSYRIHDVALNKINGKVLSR